MHRGYCMMNSRHIASVVLSVGAVAARNAGAQPADKPGGDAELAKKLSNPVAAMISVPLQNNFDFNGGPAGDGYSYILNVQPVIPFTLTDDWNLISRTIVPTIYQNSMPTTSNQGGLGDITQSLFVSPNAPGPGGLIWGVGPAAVFPTSTDDLLGSGKYSLGPTAVGLVQASGWTVGLYGNHVWSVGGSSSRSAVNATFLQPFLCYTTSTSTTFTLNSESTYDWEASKWSVPVNAVASQLLRIGPLPVQLGLGPRVYLTHPTGGADWGLRFAATILLPK